MTASIYRYTALDRNGTVHRSAMRAPSDDFVLRTLRDLQYVPQSIVDIGESESLFRRLFASPRTREKVAFWKTLANLLEHGTLLRAALESSARRCGDARLREAIAAVHFLCGRLTPAEAFATRVREFTPLEIAMLAAGERIERYDLIARELAAYFELDRRLHLKLIVELILPIALACVIVAVCAVLYLRFALPFAAVFEQRHVAMPTLLATFLAVAGWLAHPYVWLASGWSAALAIFAAIQIHGTRAGLEALDRFRLGLPALGNVLRKSKNARIAQTFAMFKAANVPRIDAVDAIIPIVGSPCYTAALRSVQETVRTNRATLGGAMDEVNRTGKFAPFDPLLVRYADNAEDSGDWITPFKDAAQALFEEVQTATSAAVQLLQPLLLGFLGILVLLLGLILYSTVWAFYLHSAGV